MCNQPNDRRAAKRFVLPAGVTSLEFRVQNLMFVGSAGEVWVPDLISGGRGDDATQPLPRLSLAQDAQGQNKLTDLFFGPVETRLHIPLFNDGPYYLVLDNPNGSDIIVFLTVEKVHDHA